ncbi:MAG: hypothetical protein U5K54_00095 [Cytophagales bacterium]|nr:hypothetical protein [Cytophagales bacterium]
MKRIELLKANTKKLSIKIPVSLRLGYSGKKTFGDDFTMVGFEALV